MHAGAKGWVRAAVGLVGPGERVLEIGSREINGSVRDLFTGASVYIGIDVTPGPGVDVVADGAVFQPPFMPDRVVCCEVLEHAGNAVDVVRRAWDALAAGGWLIVTAAAPERAPHSAVDGGAVRPGEFYAGVSGEVLASWIHAAAFDTNTVVGTVHLDHIRDRGDVYALVQKVALA